MTNTFNGMAATGFLAAGVLFATGAFAKSPEAFMKAVNADADQTISMKEVDAYAMTRFDAMNTNANKDGTLSMAEVGDRMTPAEFKAADTLHRSGKPTLSKAEFKAYVDKLFVEANTEAEPGKSGANGTLSVKELGTPAGRKLIKLLD